MKEPLKVINYTPDPFLLNPGTLFKLMYSDLKSSFSLAWRLFVRNIKAQYRQTVLGYLWAIIPPLFMTLTWVFLNTHKVINVDVPGIPYTIFVLSGTILWQTFVDAINGPLKIVNESKLMLTKINFPREALLLAGLGEVLFYFIVRIILLAAVFLYYKFPLPETLVLVPVGIISLVGMGMGIGILLTPISMLYGDINRGVIAITQVWFFLTPVIYPLPVNSLAATFIGLNPVTPLLTVTRDWMLTGNVSNLPGFIWTSLLMILVVLVGWLFYRISMPHFIARISS